MSREARELAAFSPSSSTADKANQELRAIQFRAVTAQNRLRDDVGRLGTPADTPELRRRIAASTLRFGELAQQFREAAARHPSKDSNATQKIMRDFQGLLRISEKLMATAKDKEAASMPRTTGTSSSAGTTSAAAAAMSTGASREHVERQALLEQQRKQELVQLDGELRFNDALIEERDQGITEITEQIGEVHQIFQDLAVLVHDQGEALEDIEANLTRAADRTGEAVIQVARAERSQRRTRNTWCFLMALAAGCVMILLLIILS